MLNESNLPNNLVEAIFSADGAVTQSKQTVWEDVFRMGIAPTMAQLLNAEKVWATMHLAYLPNTTRCSLTLTFQWFNSTWVTRCEAKVTLCEPPDGVQALQPQLCIVDRNLVALEPFDFADLFTMLTRLFLRVQRENEEHLKTPLMPGQSFRKIETQS